MKVTEVKMKAAKFGIKGQGMKKVALVRAIQSAEGNIVCFCTGKNECDQLVCCWREDCLLNERRVLQ